MALNAVCEDIRTLLDGAMLGDSGVDLFSFQWGMTDDGEEIDAQVMVRDDEPIQALLKDEYENPVFNIVVRGGSTEGVKTVHDRARTIYEFLLQEVRQTISGTEYVEFAPVGGLIPLGRDANNRHSFSMTFFTYRNSI